MSIDGKVVGSPIKEGTIPERGVTKAFHTMELYGFSFPEVKLSKFNPGTKLRFCIEIRLDIPALNPELGDKPIKETIAIEGCIARRDKEGNVRWMPPQSRNGAFYRNTIWVSKDFYDRVNNAIASSKFAEKLDYFHKPTAIPAQDLDPSLPARLSA